MEAETRGSGEAKDTLRDEAAIGPLLARAHLLRMRGQWDEAVAACNEALRRAPESATACSLLGDIYAARGEMERAMHWLGLAVERDPGNRADRARLDRIVARQRRALRTGKARFSPGGQERLARLLLLIGGGLFLMLASAAAFLYFGGVAPEGETPAAPPLPRGTIIVPPAPPPPAPERAAPPTSEDALRAALARSVPADASVTGIRADPRASEVALAITLPAAAAEAPSHTRERILRAAAGCLHAVARELPEMRSATIQVSLHGAPAATLAFVGNADLPALRAAGPAPASEALFARSWWTPALDPANVSDPRPAFPSAPDNRPPDRAPAPR